MSPRLQWWEHIHGATSTGSESSRCWSSVATDINGESDVQVTLCWSQSRCVNYQMLSYCFLSSSGGFLVIALLYGFRAFLWGRHGKCSLVAKRFHGSRRTKGGFVIYNKGILTFLRCFLELHKRPITVTSKRTLSAQTRIPPHANHKSNEKQGNKEKEKNTSQLIFS